MDLVWYFLRSTDIFVSRMFADVTLVDEDDEHWVEITYDADTWLPRIRGWLPQDVVRTTERAEALELVLERPVKSEGSRTYVVGTLRAGAPHLLRLVQEYFLLDLVDSRPSRQRGHA